jgi:hypothetical protein
MERKKSQIGGREEESMQKAGKRSSTGNEVEGRERIMNPKREVERMEAH